MDVIGNNIANVNTTGYKSKSLNFSDMLYQTTQAASGPNASAKTGGINPRQIGLGVKTAAINTSITTEGATQSTGNPFDLKLTGEAFFVVSDGTNTYYTRDGSFDVDEAGNLCMASTGYIVQGWGVDEEGNIMKGSLGDLNVMSKSTYDAAATTSAKISKILDKEDTDLQTDQGKRLNIQVYDALGYEYNVQFGILPVKDTITSTKSVTNTERLYQLPGSVEYQDISTFKFYKDATEKPVVAADGSVDLKGGIELTATDLPGELLEKIEEAAKTAHAGQAGTKEAVEVKIDDILTANPTIELGDASTLRGKTIYVLCSGEQGYMAYKEKGGSGVAGNTALGVVNMSDDVATALYGAAKSKDPKDVVAKYENGLLVTEQKDADGTNYVFSGPKGADKLADTIKYEDLSSLLAKDSSPVTQAQYTTTADVTREQVQDGQYDVNFIGLVDAEGNNVDITNFTGDKSFRLEYNTDNGNFSYVGAAGNDTFTLTLSSLGGNFSNLTVDMSDTTNQGNGGKSTLTGLKDDGRKVGTMSGVAIGNDGVITANYSNGMSRVLGQICVGTFANSMGLENAGDSLYSMTANSGDCVYEDIKASDIGYMTTGVLEMSNVDLSQEFTTMITTQRGFQANSRIITVSDTLLEELTNLKR